jgi:hypothetical protein
MRKRNAVSDRIRDILIGFKYDRLNLGDAMREVKEIIYTTNHNFEYRGLLKKSQEWAINNRCPACGIYFNEIGEKDKGVLNGVTYCLECYNRRLKKEADEKNTYIH